MSLIVELRERIEAFRKTIHQLDQDIVKLANVIDNHFDLNSKPMTNKDLDRFEKELMK